MKERKLYIEKALDYGKTIDRSWLTIWGVIFFSFVVLDLMFQARFSGQNLFWNFHFFSRPISIQIVNNGTFIGVTILKYLGIVLSYLYARRKFPKDYILQIALAFTLLADTILMLDNVSPLGVFAFCLAQYFHLARFAKIRPSYFIFWSGFLLMLLILGRLAQVETMYVLATIYLFSLTLNVALTCRWWRRVKANPEKYSDRELVASTCAFFGFVLFACCDFNVALSYLSVTGTLPLTLARYANFLAWFFYYPSQILISNSSVITKKPQKNLKKS
ncbi:hypothetical protein IJ798_00375 [Candidatus Saccharibacteria bacterium]|nr:hypothetical protein [Candidatus Saccharibacteria bacterium]